MITFFSLSRPWHIWIRSSFGENRSGLCRASTPQSSSQRTVSQMPDWPRTTPRRIFTVSRSRAPRTIPTSTLPHQRFTCRTSPPRWRRTTWSRRSWTRALTCRGSSFSRKTARWRWSSSRLSTTRSRPWWSCTTTSLARRVTSESRSQSRRSKPTRIPDRRARDTGRTEEALIDTQTKAFFC